eukprot:5807176-Amphidinium_carterae.1
MKRRVNNVLSVDWVQASGLRMQSCSAEFHANLHLPSVLCVSLLDSVVGAEAALDQLCLEGVLRDLLLSLCLAGTPCVELGELQKKLATANVTPGAMAVAAEYALVLSHPSIKRLVGVSGS